MKIKEMFNKKPVLSLEIFPPKPTSPIDTVVKAIDELADIKPDFISVTYGAGGTSKANTIKIVDIVKNKYGIEALAHLTCVNSTKEEILDILRSLEEINVENILALRGDPPQDGVFVPADQRDFGYAKDLVEFIKENGDFSIGGACYPEYHIESTDNLSDLRYLKEKVDAGVDFLTTQLFFDNNFFYDFKEKTELLGIDIPISAGIMPVINTKQIERITELSGAAIPPKFRRILDKYEHNPPALKEAGIAYATEQIIDLLSANVDGIHLYTMNRPEVAKAIFSQIDNIRNYVRGEENEKTLGL